MRREAARPRRGRSWRRRRVDPRSDRGAWLFTIQELNLTESNCHRTYRSLNRVGDASTLGRIEARGALLLYNTIFDRMEVDPRSDGGAWRFTIQYIR